MADTAPLTDTASVRRATPAALAAALFAISIIAANVLTIRYGIVGVGFGLTAPAGTAAAGLMLLGRDWLRATAGRTTALAAIAAGTVLSVALAGPRIAAASLVAFLAAELADVLVYQRLYRRHWIYATLAANTVGAPLDTLLFLALAGIPVWANTPGQIWVRAVFTLVPAGLVAATRAALRRRRRPRY